MHLIVLAIYLTVGLSVCVSLAVRRWVQRLWTGNGRWDLVGV